jgi:hypothetical protein
MELDTRKIRILSRTNSTPIWSLDKTVGGRPADFDCVKPQALILAPWQEQQPVSLKIITKRIASHQQQQQGSG